MNYQDLRDADLEAAGNEAALARVRGGRVGPGDAGQSRDDGREGAQVGLAERLVPVRDAGIAYGQRRSEVGLVALRRAVNAALEDVDDVPDDGDPTWPEVVAKIAAANAGAACAEQVAAELA